MIVELTKQELSDLIDALSDAMELLTDRITIGAYEDGDELLQMRDSHNRYDALQARLASQYRATFVKQQP